LEWMMKECQVMGFPAGGLIYGNAGYGPYPGALSPGGQTTQTGSPFPPAVYAQRPLDTNNNPMPWESNSPDSAILSRYGLPTVPAISPVPELAVATNPFHLPSSSTSPTGPLTGIQ